MVVAGETLVTFAAFERFLWNLKGLFEKGLIKSKDLNLIVGLKQGSYLASVSSLVILKDMLVAKRTIADLTSEDLFLLLIKEILVKNFKL